MSAASEIGLSVAMHVRGAELVALSGKLEQSIDAERSARIVDEAKKKVAEISEAIAKYEAARASAPECQHGSDSRETCCVCSG